MNDLFDTPPADGLVINSLLIEASAGSGKTFQLANRFLALVAAGVDPSEIAALTFTRKAAGEFSERILSALADGAGEGDANELAKRIRTTWNGNSESDQPPMAEGRVNGSALDQGAFLKMLRQMVDSLDRLALSTIDSFFMTVVRQFSFELGIAGFELLDDAGRAAQRERVLANLFASDPSLAKQREIFMQAFKVATFGKEEARVVALLNDFLDDHHERFVAAPDVNTWGNFEALWDGECWLPEPGDFAAKAEQVADLLEAHHPKAHKTWRKGWTKWLEWFESYRPGSSDLSEAGSTPERVMPLLRELRTGSAVQNFNRKDLNYEGDLAEAVFDLIGGFVRAEIEHCCVKTRGMYLLLHAYETEYDRVVRGKGRLAFSDLTQMLANGGLELGGRMEALAYRMDKRFKHWLLDEFQDTSRGQWRVLDALVDNAVVDPEGERSLLIVGDGKQAIYNWRGGDVRLIGELAQREDWHPRLKKWPMATSYRSSQVVLDLVNTVCDPQVSGMGDRFGDIEAVERWEYKKHTAANREIAGHATVTLVDASADDQCAIPNAQESLACRARVIAARIAEIEPIARDRTCAVIVRSNKNAVAVAEVLRQELGKSVPVEVGAEVKIANDSPVGVALSDFFRWLVAPLDDFAREHLRATPIEKFLRTHGDSDEVIWQQLRRMVDRDGVAAVTIALSDVLRSAGNLSTLNANRLDDIEQAAIRFDQVGGILDEWLASLEFLKRRDHSQRGAVQVITIHQSKGLEFDVVFLPSFGSKSLGDITRDGVIEQRSDEGIENILYKPQKDVMAATPETASLLAGMESDQTYEDFCAVYVALTRAVNAVHVLTDVVEMDSEKANVDGWVLGAVGGGLAKAERGFTIEHICYEEGDPQWFTKFELKTESESDDRDEVKLGTAVARRRRRAPSDHGSDDAKADAVLSVSSGAGLRFGSEVHALFERVEWLDGVVPELGDSDAATLVRKTLGQPEVMALFARPKKGKLFREQAVEGILDGVWVSGVIDRLVVNYDANSSPISAKIIDFKTDVVDDESVLVERYAKQLKTYQGMVALTLGLSLDAVSVVMVATHLGRVIEVR